MRVTVVTKINAPPLTATKSCSASRCYWQRSLFIYIMMPHTYGSRENKNTCVENHVAGGGRAPLPAPFRVFTFSNERRRGRHLLSLAGCLFMQFNMPPFAVSWTNFEKSKFIYFTWLDQSFYECEICTTILLVMVCTKYKSVKFN